ncbi:MAG: hypothetical protein HYR56_19875 [Acidobacteria bacterium]|nr:hypothetical protein [Acidobacteriota bacterium]MBI3421903.1 hypothetical protein [Acidobacteriota bacterium]
MLTRQQIRFCLLTLFWVSAVFLPRQSGSAHEPITTKVTFNKEIARIFQRSCWGCHTEGKVKGDIPLTTYEEARPWAKAIKEEILEKRMPPYQAVKGYGSFAHDYILPQREVELIVSWVEGGAPKGEAKHYPEAQNGWALGAPDLLLQPEKESQLSGEGNEIARCFALPTGLKANAWLRALDFQPGNGPLVQRATFAVHTGVGNPCGKAEAATNPNSLSQWVPGHAPLQLPTGTGRLLPAGAQIQMTIHYRLNGEAAHDRSQLALYFIKPQAKDAAPKAVRNVALTAAPVKLAVKDELQLVKATLTLTEATEVIAVRPLLFPFGQSVEVTAHRPDGSSEVLIWARNYRFNWQPDYVFRTPLALPRGTRLEATAYLDNSDNNPNNPNETAKAVSLSEPLCELLLAGSPTARAKR